MKITFTHLIFLCATLVVINACQDDNQYQEVHSVDWTNQKVKKGMISTSISNYTYLPIYSNVYTKSDKETRSLTATVSIHNMNLVDSLFIKKADYFNSKGDFVRSYVKETIFLEPMETVDIVIHERDNIGGTGANFLIEWMRNNSNANPPLIEAVMISTNGQQGISFTTRGVIMNQVEKIQQKEILDTTKTKPI